MLAVHSDFDGMMRSCLCPRLIGFGACASFRTSPTGLSRFVRVCVCGCVACAACAAFWHNSHFEVYFGLSRHLSWNISLHFEVALHVITTSDGIAKE